MKKKIWLAALICVSCVFFVLSACAKAQEEISISITNKEALTAEWIEEGESRTVELSITPDRYTVNNSEIVVTSDNSAVVKADGLTLSAMGGGTANVTVSLGNASDRVAITVMPKLRGISITNKDELGEIWCLGDADRTLDVAQLFKNSTLPLTASDVTVTSSAPEIIEADGLTLRAKAIGNDAIITVTYGEFSDTVALSVVETLETFEITDKSALANLALGDTCDFSSFVSFTPSLYNTENTHPVITCEPAGIIEQVDDYQIKAVAEGSAIVTVTVRDKSDTFTVSVAYGTPKIIFEVDDGSARFEETEEGATLDVVQTGYYNSEAEVVLPTVYAMTTDGNAIENIEIKNGAEVITGNTVKLTKGTHQLTYSAADPRDDSKVATKILTVNVYRKIFSYKGPYQDTNPEWDYMVSKEYVDDEEQVVKVGSQSISRSIFNMAPSTLYYAEVTFILPAYSESDVDTDPIMGMGHFVGDEKTRRLSCIVGRKSGNIFVTDYQAGNIWDNPIGGEYNTSSRTSLTEKDGYVFPANTSDTEGLKVKIGIARSGNIYYLFINDVLMEVRDMTGVADGYYEDPSIPGISGDRLSQTTMIDIRFFGGSDAQDKINGLIPTPEITNKSAFEEEIDQTFTGKVEVSVTPEYYNNDSKLKCSFTSSNDSIVTVDEDGTLTAIANGEATITVTIGDKSDSVTVTVAFKADTPVLTLTAPAEADNVKYTATEEGATLDVVQTGYYDEDTTVTLPIVTAKLGDTDISDSLVVTLDGSPATFTGNTVTLSKGTHTIIYTATNDDDSKSVAKTLTINVYRKIFSYKGPNAFLTYDDGTPNPHPEWDYIVSTENAADEDQVVIVGSGYLSRSIFNMAPSTLYYAEVTFILPAYSESDVNTDPLMGMGHFVGDEKVRRLSYIVGRKSGNIFVTDLKEGMECWQSPFADGTYNVNSKTSLTEKDGYVFPANTSATEGLKVKIGIARSGNIYYLFINDVLMEVRDMTGVADGYYEDPSIPGISGDRLSQTTMIDIRFFGGSDAQDKINGLIPTPEITNKSAFEEEIDQTFTGKVEVSVTPEYYNNDSKLKCSFTSSNDSIVTVDEDGTLTAIANGEATITVTIGDKSDSVTVTVAFKADTPVLTLTAPAEADNVKYTATEEGATLDVVQTGYYDEDTTVTLPIVTAKLGDTDISDSLVVTLDGSPATFTGNTVTLSKGTHTIIYTATNDDDSKSVTKTLTINVYRKIFSYKGPNQDTHPEWDYMVSKEYVDDEEQIVKVGSQYLSRSIFNMAPSTLYYAEVTFILPAYLESDVYTDPLMGMGHFVGDEKVRRLSYIVGRKSGNIFVTDLKEGMECWQSPFADGTYNVNSKTSLTEKDGYVFPANTSATEGLKVKIGIARSGNIYYLFINDVLMEVRDMTGVADGYYEDPSIPGISGDRLSQTTMIDIRFFGGSDAQDKINGLVAASNTQSAGVYRSPDVIVNKKEGE